MHYISNGAGGHSKGRWVIQTPRVLKRRPGLEITKESCLSGGQVAKKSTHPNVFVLVQIVLHLSTELLEVILQNLS